GPPVAWGGSHGGLRGRVSKGGAARSRSWERVGAAFPSYRHCSVAPLTPVEENRPSAAPKERCGRGRGSRRRGRPLALREPDPPEPLMEPAAPATDTTQLLLAARDGRSEATERLFAHLYEELRALAHLHLSAHRPLATLETGGLLHEAYLRLVDRGRITPADRAHFFAIAAQAMRFVLLDRARARQRQKRGG